MQTVIIKNELNGNRVRSAWQRESIQSCGMNSLTLSILLGLVIDKSQKTTIQAYTKTGKPIVRWGHKAIGSCNRIAWLQKGVHRDAPNHNDSNYFGPNRSNNVGFFLGWPTKHSIKTPKKKTYFNQNKSTENRHLSPLAKNNGLFHIHISKKPKWALSCKRQTRRKVGTQSLGSRKG